MDNAFYELLHQCTVRLVDPRSREQGTGFFVAPGMILTCGHVVKKASNDPQVLNVSWETQTCSVQEIECFEAMDLALVQIVSFSGHPCVLLDEDITPSDPLYSYGYPAKHSDGDSATFNFEGWTQEGDERLLKFNAGQVEPGMSGAPLLNERTGGVCGIIARTRDRSTDLGGRGIWTKTVWQVIPRLKEPQRQFHQTDQRWSTNLESFQSDRSREASVFGKRPAELVLSDQQHLNKAPYFTGRVQDKQWLCQQLLQEPQGRVITLAAPGGMGKTSLVAEAMHQIFPDTAGTIRFPHGCFLHDFYRQPDVAAALEGLATRLDSSKGARSMPRALAEAVQEVLRSRKLLLIFDGVENLTQPNDLSTLLDACHGQTILLLTRNRNQMVDPQAMRDLTTLQPDDALDVLKAWVQNNPCLTDTQFRLLCQLVGNLPLALRIAGRYLCLHTNEAPAYLEELRQSPLSVLTQEDKEHESVPILLQRTIAHLSESAQQALAVVALLAPAPFEREFLAEVLDWQPPELRQALGDVQDYSLLVASQQQYEVSHALIHTYAQTELLPRIDPTLRMTYGRRLVATLSKQLGPEETLPERIRQFLPHIQACLNLPEQDRRTMLDRALLFNRTGDILYQHASYAEAESMYWQVLRIRKQQFESEDQQIVPSLTNLANVYSQLGKYRGAEKLYQDALTICEQQPDPTYTVNGLNNLASFYSRQGKYTEAEPLYVRALTICESRFDSNHLHTASCLTNLANMYVCLNERYKEAKPLYARALTICESRFGLEHPNLVSYLTNLANVYAHQSQSKAESLYKRALDICEQHFGLEHLETAKSLDNLASFYLRRYKGTKARQLYEHALAIREHLLDLEHPETAQNLDNLANVYVRQRKHAKAQQLYERALTIRKRQFGPEHSETAQSLDNLANVYVRQRNYTKAQQYYEDALTIRKQHFGDKHPAVVSSLSNLAGFYSRRKKYTEAMRLYERALAICTQKGLGINHPEIERIRRNYTNLRRRRSFPKYIINLSIIVIAAESVYFDTLLFFGLSLLAFLSFLFFIVVRDEDQIEQKNPVFKYFLQRRNRQTEQQLYRRALDPSKQMFSFDHRDTSDNLDNLDNLASSHFRQGRYAEAKPLYIRAVDICNQQFGPDHLITATYLHKLANVYSRQREFSIAKQYYERVLSIREPKLDPNRLDIANTLNDQANIYFRQRMFKKAQESYKRALDISKKQRGPNNPETQHIQERYFAAIKLRYLEILSSTFFLFILFVGSWALYHTNEKKNDGLAFLALLLAVYLVSKIPSIRWIEESEKDSPLR
ncbi:MAG TPA: tetratricopeptide repeat protein [Ktedonobacteraceae bacterium]|nr:tetratricopeptide repeat protein [Ktedonobacteraceae bacterium]